MSFDYQTTNRYFAQIAGSIEKIGADELTILGATNVKPAFRGAYFEADRETLYRINYCSRLSTRILAPLVSFECLDDASLYENGKNVAWEELFGLDETFAVFANTVHSAITHSQYASLKLKDAICDRFRERNEDKRPSVDRETPTVWLNLHIQNNQATISLDTSGGSLHKRGYRSVGVEAPLQETLGSAIIALSGWDEKRPLCDPFCGSGTLLAEAHMRACSIPAGYLRKRWGFVQLPDYDEALWTKVKATADAQIRRSEGLKISGSDYDRSAVEAARSNLNALPFGDTIDITKKDFRYVEDLKNAQIVANLPYGVRLEATGGIDRFYAEIGSFLRRSTNRPCRACLFVGDRNDSQYFGMAAAAYIPLVNGDIQGCLVNYDITDKNDYIPGKEKKPRFENTRHDRDDRDEEEDSRPKRSFDDERPGYKKPFGGDRDDNRSERPSFGRDRDERPSFGGDRPFKKSFGDRDERPSFGGADRGSFKKPYESRGDKPSFGRDRDERPSFGGDRPFKKSYDSHDSHKSHGDKPSFGGADRGGFKKPYESRGDKPSFGRDRDERPSFGGDRPFKKSFGGDRDERPSFGGDRPYKKSYDSHDSHKSHGDKPSFGGDRGGFKKPYEARGDKPSFGADRGGDRPYKKSYDSHDSHKSHGDKPSFGSDRGGFKKPYESKGYGHSDKPAYKKTPYQDRGERTGVNPDRDERSSSGPQGYTPHNMENRSFSKGHGDRSGQGGFGKKRDDRGGSFGGGRKPEGGDRSGPRFRGH